MVSGLNSMILNRDADFLGYTRGSDDEYDRWANITMDSGWSWTSLEAFYRKVTTREIFPFKTADFSRAKDWLILQMVTILLGKSIQVPTAMGPLKSVFPDILRRLTIASYSVARNWATISSST